MPSYDGPTAHSKESWEAYSKIRDLESEQNVLYRFNNFCQNLFDRPVTWFRTTVVEPLREKHRMPYYHYKFKRFKTIDECDIDDPVCLHEANFQYRIDLQVDREILNILRQRMQGCLRQNNHARYRCVKAIEDYEETELNWFIKYGEMCFSDDVVTAYMKQKHRMIWERRHPEIMEERQHQLEKHKRQVADGIFNLHFWKTGQWWQERNDIISATRRGFMFQSNKWPDQEVETPLKTPAPKGEWLRSWLGLSMHYEPKKKEESEENAEAA